MRRLTLSLTLLFVAVSATPSRAGMWLSNSVTNPGAGQVILTTGSLSTQSAAFVVYIFASVATPIAVERLDPGSNVITNDSITVTVPANLIVQLPMGVLFNAGDTFRIRNVSALTGTVFGALRFNDVSSQGYCLQGLGCQR